MKIFQTLYQNLSGRNVKASQSNRFILFCIAGDCDSVSFSNSARVMGGVEPGLEHRPGVRVWVRVPIHNRTEHR